MRAQSRLCCLLLLASATASAGNLYKWTDANGVTQYSERPPTGQKYETRRVTSSGASIPEPVATPGAASEDARCLAARQNLQLLNGSGPVMHDTDGDGKPDTQLDDSQRAAQRQLAESMAAVYCKDAAKN
ncbi:MULTISPECIES: DUF4124 domain-containing protein [unclassified Stenotrophomonas]|uniref:DUF4124 domain-containing protein n=1 Tax=unclassified Stenotrophomonas TaxID=196198 RepID=UPI0025FF76DC|nr:MULTISPECIES: DUF4124 domain-containing protein [unclassified Stenotrophomonas]